MEQTLVPPRLTAHDRCDRCGAQAQTVRHFKSGDLLFCSHHDRAYAVALEVQEIAKK